MVPIEWRVYEAGYCTHSECATRRGAPIAAARFPALAFLLQHPIRGNVLFDTGYAQHFMRATQHLPERLYRAVTPVQLQAGDSLCSQLGRDGIAADSIALVVLSHFHGDHIGGLLDFPKAAIICSREAWEDLRSHSRIGALRRGLLPKLLPADFLDRVSWVEDAPSHDLPGTLAEFGRGHDIFNDGSVLAVSLPGHAAGHYGLLFRDRQEQWIFLIADAAWSSLAVREGVPPPAIVTSLLGDTRAYRDTLRRLQRLSRHTPSIRMLPSHCSEWKQS